MRLTISEAWGLIVAHILPTMLKGDQFGALVSNVAGKPHIEWAYNTHTDTLMLLEFVKAPTYDGQHPDHIHEFAQFGRACMDGGMAAVALVANPDPRVAGLQPPAGAPTPLGGLPPMPPMPPAMKSDPDDTIGFKPRRKT